MPQPPVVCPYCNTGIPLATIRQTSRVRFGGSEIFETEDTSSREILSHDLSCPLCERNYKYIDLSDFSWVIRRLEPSNTMLETLKTKFPEADLDSVYENIIGVTRPTGTLRRIFKGKRLHICFELRGVRAYIDCHLEKDRLRGLNIFEV